MGDENNELKITTPGQLAYEAGKKFLISRNTLHESVLPHCLPEWEKLHQAERDWYEAMGEAVRADIHESIAQGET